jgi:16S rRNA (guanine(966)-N(2))-methyltransferase RsmD
MRIVAGTYGGRRLTAPRGAATRPTADRVREAVFSMLGALDAEIVLDLFAGSGALGIEALSRGAARATFVDSADKAIAAVRDNLDTLGIGRPDPAEVRRRDALAFLREARAQERHYSLVLLDPPYRRAASLAAVLSDALPPILDPGARVVSESDRRTPLELALPLADERRYGDTLIRIHTT